MNFARTDLWNLLALVPLALLLLVWRERRRQKRLQLFAADATLKHLLPEEIPGRRWLKDGLILLAFTSLIMAMVRPRWGFEWREVTHKGIDIMVALDVSRSMRAQDVSPSRLERAKREMVDLLRVLRGDRIGLIAFAGLAFVQCPLTVDYSMMQLFLDNLDDDLIPVQGTSLGAAIELGVKALKEGSPGHTAGKILLVISDGEDQKSPYEKAIEEARQAGVQIHTIGIGSRAGAPIPEVQGGFVKDATGNVVQSRLSTESLQAIASATGGRYWETQAGAPGLEDIYRQHILKGGQEGDFKTTREQKWYEQYHWFSLLALLVLLGESRLSRYKLNKI